MASTASIQDENTTCTICHEVLSNTRILSCYHSFCGKCVAKFESEKQGNEDGVSCPMCRKFTTKQHIQPNLILDKLIEKLTVLNQQSVINRAATDKVCHQCDKSEATSYCQECDFELCEVCSKTHLRILNCEHHRIALIAQLPMNLSIVVTKFCDVHPESAIKYNCKQCNKAICVKCKIDLHDTHETESVDEAIGKITPFLNTYMKLLEDNNKIRAERRVALDQCVNILNCASNAALRKAKDEMDVKIASLQHDFEVLTEKTKSEQNAIEKEIGIMIQDLDSNISSARSMIKWGETLLQAQGPAVLVELQGDVIHRFNSLASEKQDLQSSFEFLRHKMKEPVFVPVELTAMKLNLCKSGNMVGNMSWNTVPMMKNENESTSVNTNKTPQEETIKDEEKSKEKYHSRHSMF